MAGDTHGSHDGGRDISHRWLYPCSRRSCHAHVHVHVRVHVYVRVRAVGSIARFASEHMCIWAWACACIHTCTCTCTRTKQRHMGIHAMTSTSAVNSIAYRESHSRDSMHQQHGSTHGSMQQPHTANTLHYAHTHVTSVRITTCLHDLEHIPHQRQQQHSTQDHGAPSRHTTRIVQYLLQTLVRSLELQDVVIDLVLNLHIQTCSARRIHYMCATTWNAFSTATAHRCGLLLVSCGMVCVVSCGVVSRHVMCRVVTCSIMGCCMVSCLLASVASSLRSSRPAEIYKHTHETRMRTYHGSTCDTGSYNIQWLYVCALLCVVCCALPDPTIHR